jgi:hypothetical protein
VCCGGELVGVVVWCVLGGVLVVGCGVLEVCSGVGVGGVWLKECIGGCCVVCKG